MNLAPPSLRHPGTIAARHPERLAVTMADGSASLTYAQLDQRSRQIAIHLRNQGLQRGDHIAVLLRNRPDYLCVLWAAQRAGLYFTPLNWHLNKEELSYIVADCGAKALFTASEDAGVAEAAASPTVYVRLVDGPAVGSFTALTAVYDSIDPGTALDECEGQSMCYSSGTTGRPKGIKRANAFSPLGSATPPELLLQQAYGLDEHSVNLQMAPMYHAAPMTWALATTRFGGTLVLMEKFDALAALANVQRYRVTHLHMVPTMMVRLLDVPEAQRRAADMSSLKCVVHAAAPCPPEAKRQWIEWVGPIVMEYYAGSEGNGLCVVSATEWLARPGTVGRAVYGQIHILDEAGHELPAGEVGTIYFGGTPSFEYHNDPEKTRAMFSPQGYSTMGDFGHVDADGYLYIADRRTDLIVSGGVNIYPRETEEALLSHPAVLDAAVIGVPSPDFGQDVMAVVQLRDGTEGSDRLRDELIEFCRSRIAHFKCPRRVAFQTLPRTPTGKLLRRELKAQFATSNTASSKS